MATGFSLLLVYRWYLQDVNCCSKVVSPLVAQQMHLHLDLLSNPLHLCHARRVHGAGPLYGPRHVGQHRLHLRRRHDGRHSLVSDFSQPPDAHWCASALKPDLLGRVAICARHVHCTVLVQWSSRGCCCAYMALTRCSLDQAAPWIRRTCRPSSGTWRQTPSLRWAHVQLLCPHAQQACIDKPFVFGPACKASTCCLQAVYDAKSEEIGPGIFRFKAEIGAQETPVPLCACPNR
jgi:hypothetical protein